MLASLIHDRQMRPLGVYATVSRAPATADDTLDVLWTSASDGVEAEAVSEETGLRWASRGGVLPAVGDDALLLTDSRGDPWAVCWPSGATPTGTPVVTALPASPVDGQEIRYRFVPTQTPATTIPLIWHLRWDAANGAWLPVGDPRPILAYYATGATNSMGPNAWGTYDANDPRLTVPLAGTYEVESGTSECYGGAAGNYMNIGAFRNGSQISTQHESGTLLNAGGGGGMQLRISEIVLAANDQMRQFYYLTASSVQNIVMRNRYLTVRPMRITG